MRRSGFIFTLLFMSLCAQVSFAQVYSGGTNTQGGPFAGESFTEIKTRVLRMIEERKTRIEQEKACVQAAANEEDLKKCRPVPPMGMGRGPGNMQGGRPGGM